MIRLFQICILLITFSQLATATATTTNDDTAPRTLVHLLDYLAADYGGAVENGKVISKFEYDEQTEFAATVLELSRKLPESGLVQTKAKALQSSILQKADAKQVAAQAREIQTLVLQVTKLTQSPERWPSVNNGKRLYAQTCTGCHGVEGKGDGPAGKGLDPAPANFHDAARMNERTPFQLFNAIRIGIPGTGMAAQAHLSDKEVWDLAYYLSSMRHKPAQKNIGKPFEANADFLKLVAVSTDSDLTKAGYDPSRVRLYEEAETSSLDSIQFAMATLRNAYDDYTKGDHDKAAKLALTAYLEGVEPVEPRLRAADPKFLIRLEEAMGSVRTGMSGKVMKEELQNRIHAAEELLEQAESMLESVRPSPWLSFTLAVGILLREGFEAVLILIALLGVIRAANARKAENWLHAGWIAAVSVGVITWFFSGWATQMSGASRELMEGLISLFAVIVLLYIGFWLHSRTEIGRWKAFLDGKVKSALDGGNLFGIAMISFFAVFREAFETVLFLRAISLEAGSDSQFALAAGVGTAFVAVLFMAWLLLRFSSRIPVRKLFGVSSILMIVLAVILTGKSFHALQEAGVVGANSVPFALRIDLIGFYPTTETVVAQLVILLLSFALWAYGKKA